MILGSKLLSSDREITAATRLEVDVGVAASNVSNAHQETLNKLAALFGIHSFFKVIC